MEIPGGGGGGGSKVNMPFMGGMDIFWNYTIIDMLLASFLLVSTLLANIVIPKTKRKTKIT